MQDDAKAKDWANKARSLHHFRNHGQLGEGKDKGSNFIITENDLEQYDQIIEAMNAKYKAAQSWPCSGEHRGTTLGRAMDRNR